jgi:hypothetical protein
VTRGERLFWLARMAMAVISRVFNFDERKKKVKEGVNHQIQNVFQFSMGNEKCDSGKNVRQTRGWA